MIYTNKHGISPLIASMIQKSMEQYDSGDSKYSCTRLIDSPRIVRLTKEYYNEIEIDVADLMPAFFGNAMHKHLEELADMNDIAEKRFFAEVDGIKISCCIDILEFVGVSGYRVGDYKTVKSWAVVFGSAYEKWGQQLNINAWIAKQNGFSIDLVTYIEYFIMDFQKSRVGQNNYPKLQQGRWETILWPEEKQLEFIRKRINLHEQAEKELPLCSDKDTWKKDDWKLFKKGRKTAVKRENTLEELEEYAFKKKIMRNDKSLIKGYSIECIPGEHKRCKEYCNAAKFCKQWEENNR